MKKWAILLLVLGGCSSMNQPPADPIKPVDPNPNHLPADILAMSPKSYLIIPAKENYCKVQFHRPNDPSYCSNGYAQEGSDLLCYCVPRKK